MLQLCSHTENTYLFLLLLFILFLFYFIRSVLYVIMYEWDIKMFNNYNCVECNLDANAVFLINVVWQMNSV